MNKLMRMLLNKRFAPVTGDGTDVGGSGGEDDDLDWLLQDGDDEVESVDDIVTAPEGDVAPEEEAEKVVEEVVPEVVEEVEEVGEVEEPPEVEEEVPELEGTPEERKAKFLSEVEKSFAISDDDANLILTEPEKILPRLATAIYDRAMSDVSQLISQQMQAIPQMMKNLQAQESSAQKVETEFRTINPQLKDIDSKQLEELITLVGPKVVASQKGKPQEEVMRALGQAIGAIVGVSASEPVPAKKPRPAPAPQPYSPVAPAHHGGELGKPRPNNEAEAFIFDLLNNPDD